jgi:hypothetical protein
MGGGRLQMSSRFGLQSIVVFSLAKDAAVLNPWINLTVLAAQSQRAFMLRMMQMSLGGRAAQREPATIALEKPSAPARKPRASATAAAATAVKRAAPSERAAKAPQRKQKTHTRRRSRTK